MEEGDHLVICGRIGAFGHKDVARCKPSKFSKLGTVSRENSLILSFLCNMIPGFCQLVPELESWSFGIVTMIPKFWWEGDPRFDGTRNAYWWMINLKWVRRRSYLRIGIFDGIEKRRSKLEVFLEEEPPECHIFLPLRWQGSSCSNQSLGFISNIQTMGSKNTDVETKLSKKVVKDYGSHHQLPLATVQFLRESWDQSQVGVFQGKKMLQKTDHERRMKALIYLCLTQEDWKPVLGIVVICLAWST